MASASFTAVGASTTVGNAKIWSTLGGTTGIGAATTAANANVTADQNAISGVNAILENLNTAVANAGTDYSKIYLTASIYAKKCVAIANSSSGTTALTQSTQPSRPSAPTIGTATGGDSQVSVTFTPPLSDGGATITGYTAVASPGGKSASGTSSPIVVKDLTNGDTYTFTVSATNSAGTGSASASSVAVTPN